jgi:hypothetical protein
MSATHATTSSRSFLPDHPSLEHLRKEAKQRLGKLRGSGASAQLADAQLLVAREYGFSSWRALKAAVERTAPSTAYHRPPLNHHRLAHAAMSDRMGVENAFYSFMAVGVLLTSLAISVDFSGHRAVSSSDPVVVDVQILH